MEKTKQEQDERFTITMTKEQLLWLMQTMEKWSRFEMGQTDGIHRELCGIWKQQHIDMWDDFRAPDEYWEMDKELNALLKQVNKLIWENGERYNESGNIAWDFYQSIRYFKWCHIMSQEDRDKIGEMTAMSDEPMRVSKLPLPIVYFAGRLKNDNNKDYFKNIADLVEEDLKKMKNSAKK